MAKSPFEHVNEIYMNQDIDYFDNLTEADKKSLSPYMVNRIISMVPNFLPMVNEFQKYLNEIGARETYLFYSQLIPKGKHYGKYIKKSKTNSLEDWVIELVGKYYAISFTEAEYYINIMMLTDEGKTELKNILGKFGTDPKKIKKLKIF